MLQRVFSIQLYKNDPLKKILSIFFGKYFFLDSDEEILSIFLRGSVFVELNRKHTL